MAKESKELYDNVVSKIATVIPMFAKAIVDMGLEKYNATPYTVTPAQMRKIINEEIIPKFKKFIGTPEELEAISGGVIMLDRDDKVVSINLTARRLIGVGREVPLDDKKIFERAKQLGLIQSTLETSKSGGQTLIKELKLEEPKVILNIISSLIRDEKGEVTGAIFFFQDITLRAALELEMEERLQESEQYLKTIFNASAAGILVIDPEAHKIVDANSTIIKMIGLPEDQIIGCVCHNFVCPAEKGKCPITDLKQRVDTSERILLKANGEKIQVLKSVVPITRHGREYLLELVLDITERKRAEMDLKNAYEQLKQTQIQLVQSAKMSAIGQLSAGVAHEINNPLGGILGYAQFILSKLGGPEFTVDDFKTCRKYLEYIEKESQRCKQIVESLLTFSRKSSEKFESVDVKSTMETIFSILRRSLELQNIKVTIEYAPQPLQVFGNANKLQQVFANIIINTQQAMPNGGELIISAKVVEKDKKKKVAISFQDTGCGIPKENLESVFEPFFTTKQEMKSLGLGLAICYEIIQEHNGEILVESEVGKGTKFTIILPCSDKPH